MTSPKHRLFQQAGTMYDVTDRKILYRSEWLENHILKHGKLQLIIFPSSCLVQLPVPKHGNYRFYGQNNPRLWLSSRLMTLYIRDRLNRHFLKFSYTEEVVGSSPIGATRKPPQTGVFCFKRGGCLGRDSLSKL